MYWISLQTWCPLGHFIAHDAYWEHLEPKELNCKENINQLSQIDYNAINRHASHNKQRKMKQYVLSGLLSDNIEYNRTHIRTVWLYLLNIVKPLIYIAHISRRCSNYIFILDLTPGFNGLSKDNCKTKRKKIQFWDMVGLILEVWWYMFAYMDVYLFYFYDLLLVFFNCINLSIYQRKQRILVSILLQVCSQDLL